MLSRVVIEVDALPKDVAFSPCVVKGDDWRCCLFASCPSLLALVVFIFIFIFLFILLCASLKSEYLTKKNYHIWGLCPTGLPLS